MARRTRAEAEETREKLLDSALELFYERGYAGTNLTSIAKQLGLTKGAVYWHFSSKTALLFALAERMEARIRAYHPPHAERTPTLRALTAEALSYLSVVATDEDLYRYYNLLYFRMEWQDELSPVMEFLYQLDDAELSWAGKVMQAEREAGQLGGAAPSTLAAGWLALRDGWLGRILMTREDRASLLPAAELSFSVFARGLSAPAPVAAVETPA